MEQDNNTSPEQPAGPSHPRHWDMNDTPPQHTHGNHEGWHPEHPAPAPPAPEPWQAEDAAPAAPAPAPTVATAEPAQVAALPPATDGPVPVVKVLSTRGVEYFMMSFTLWLGAGSLIWALLALIDNYNGFSTLAFPVSALIVCVPVFAFFFLRLRKQELANSSLRYEPSKRRLTQITQFLAFLTCLFNVIAFIYMLMSRAGSSSGGLPIWKLFVNLLVVLMVAGGILVYYWVDEHRQNRG